MTIERTSDASRTTAGDNLAELAQAILEPGCFVIVGLMILSFVFALTHPEQFAELASVL